MGLRPWVLLSSRRTWRSEVDGPIAAALQLAYEVVGGADLRLEVRRADADEADEVRVAAAERPVAVAARELGDARVLPLPAAAVEGLDGDDARERRLRLVVRAQ